MKQFQIRTYNDEHLAKAIQEKLFELGYRWRSGGMRISADHYCASRSGYLTRGNIIQRADSWFGEFITLDELFQMKAEPKETIKIGNSTYDKAEFEEATKNLSPIQ